MSVDLIRIVIINYFKFFYSGLNIQSKLYELLIRVTFIFFTKEKKISIVSRQAVRNLQLRERPNNRFMTQEQSEASQWSLRRDDWSPSRYSVVCRTVASRTVSLRPRRRPPGPARDQQTLSHPSVHRDIRTYPTSTIFIFHILLNLSYIYYLQII